MSELTHRKFLNCQVWNITKTAFFRAELSKTHEATEEKKGYFLKLSKITIKLDTKTKSSVLCCLDRLQFIKFYDEVIFLLSQPDMSPA